MTNSITQSTNDRPTYVSGGGHNLELGLRAWLCGHNGPSGADDELEEEADDAEISSVNARLKLSVCSRVAVKDDLKAREVGTKANARRIIELWSVVNNTSGQNN